MTKKSLIGYLLFVCGLTILAVSIQQDGSVWWYVISSILIIFGLDFYIDSKIDERINKLK